MKKIFPLLIILIFLLTSCSFGDDNMSFLKENDNAIADETFSTVISAINLQDDSKIKNLFSESIQDEVDNLQKKSIEFLEFIRGNLVSFSVASDAGVGADYKIEKGKKRKEIQSSFHIVTTEDTYYIAIKECTQDELNSSNVGLVSIYIIESKSWNGDYIYRGDGEWTHGINIITDSVM